MPLQHGIIAVFSITLCGTIGLTKGVVTELPLKAKFLFLGQAIPTLGVPKIYV